MGFTFFPGANKNDVIKEIKEEIGFKDKSVHLSDFSLRGNNLWCLINDDGKGIKRIGLFQLEKVKGEGWGYKLMDESVGPLQSNCPLKLLEKATALDETEVYARDFRDRVRAHHEQSKKAKEMAQSLAPGRMVRVRATGETFTLLNRKSQTGGSWIVRSERNKQLYNLPPRFFKGDQLEILGVSAGQKKKEGLEVRFEGRVEDASKMAQERGEALSVSDWVIAKPDKFAFNAGLALMRQFNAEKLQMHEFPAPGLDEPITADGHDDGLSFPAYNRVVFEDFEHDELNTAFFMRESAPENGGDKEESPISVEVSISATDLRQTHGSRGVVDLFAVGAMASNEGSPFSWEQVHAVKPCFRSCECTLYDKGEKVVTVLADLSGDEPKLLDTGDVDEDALMRLSWHVDKQQEDLSEDNLQDDDLDDLFGPR